MVLLAWILCAAWATAQGSGDLNVYRTFDNTNTYDGHGSHDLTGNYLWHPTTPHTCSRLCTAIDACECAVYIHETKWGFKAGDCVGRASCRPEYFEKGVAGFSVLVPWDFGCWEVKEAREWSVNELDTLNACKSGSQGCSENATKHSDRAQFLIEFNKKAKHCQLTAWTQWEGPPCGGKPHFRYRWLHRSATGEGLVMTQAGKSPLCEGQDIKGVFVIGMLSVVLIGLGLFLLCPRPTAEASTVVMPAMTGSGEKHALLTVS